VNAAQPSLAGMYDYTLGGTLNKEADRIAVEQIRELIPELSAAVWANRGFVQRAAKWMAEHGIRQFLDIGAGLPTMNNTHDVVQAIVPDATVVYADHDAEVVQHGRRLVADVEHTVYLQHDLREPERLLADPALRAALDLDQPVGLLVVGVLDFLSDAVRPWDLVRQILDAFPSGSYLALSHNTADNQDPAAVQRVLEVFATAPEPLRYRTRAEVERFVEGLEPMPPYEGAEPGVAYIGLWGADNPEEADDDTSRWWYAVIARKP
jgi:S-adenosyl methyltransferase